ncbi:hypothetical protein BC332_08155 [Capsicum chinense]|nr:hypothetical protein BC332_08155 [Capsicum chinense]
MVRKEEKGFRNFPLCVSVYDKIMKNESACLNIECEISVVDEKKRNSEDDGALIEVVDINEHDQTIISDPNHDEVLIGQVYKDKATLKVAPIAPFSACFNSSNIASTRVGPAVPPIDLVLQNENVVWRIFGANSMVQASENILCLGVVDVGLEPRTAVVIGGHTIENNLLQFDLAISRLGFASSILSRQTTWSSYSIMVNQIDGSFINYFLAFGACIRGYIHTGKNLKSIVEDEPILCVISDRHISIVNDFSHVYSRAHHGLCMRHLTENLRVNQHCGEHLYLFYAAAKAYTVDEFSEHFSKLKNNSPKEEHVLKNVLGFEKLIRAHFPGNRYDVMTTNIAESLNSVLMDEREYPMSYIFNSIARNFGEKFRERHAFVDGQNNKFMPCAERILRDNKSVSDSLYVSNANGVSTNSRCSEMALLPRSIY